VQNEIIEKLTRELNGRITTEAQTVYLLVEIRKLMEQNKTKEFDTMKMFCDWCLHVSLDRNKQIKKFLDEFDEAIGKIDHDSCYDQINNCLSLNKFKEDMTEFLKEFGLPVIESAQWSKFIRLYSDVVSDCPITGKDHEFKIIKEIRITRQPDNAPSDLGEGFYLHWQVTKKDGGYGEFRIPMAT
jgi:hypothetical protein